MRFQKHLSSRIWSYRINKQTLLLQFIILLRHQINDLWLREKWRHVLVNGNNFNGIWTWMGELQMQELIDDVTNWWRNPRNFTIFKNKDFLIVSFHTIWKKFEVNFWWRHQINFYFFPFSELIECCHKEDRFLKY